MDADVRHPTDFTHDRDRLLEADVARDVLVGLMSLPKVRRLMSGKDFSVDGAVIDAWASMKSFRPNDGSVDPPQPGRKTAIDRHTTHHPGYGVRQRCRKRTEEVFG
jgi:hypothetical protein